MKRKPIYPAEGYVFQHKEKLDEFACVLYLGQGVSLDDYKEITEEEYEQAMLASLPSDAWGV